MCYIFVPLWLEIRSRQAQLSQVKYNQLFAELFIARFVFCCFPFVHERRWGWIVIFQMGWGEHWIIRLPSSADLHLIPAAVLRHCVGDNYGERREREGTVFGFNSTKCVKHFLLLTFWIKARSLNRGVFTWSSSLHRCTPSGWIRGY